MISRCENYFKSDVSRKLTQRGHKPERQHHTCGRIASACAHHSAAGQSATDGDKHEDRSKFVAYLATGGRSKKTVENVLLTLSSILRTARSWDYACGNFSLAYITMPREGVKKEQRHFTDEEVGKILSAAPEPFGTILAVTAVLGLRIGEVLALRISDIDFTRKIVRVRQSVDAATRNVQAVKSQASGADVPMPSQLAARLRVYLCTHDPLVVATPSRRIPATS